MFSPIKAATAATLIACALHSRATSMKAFYAMSQKEQASLVSDYVIKMRNDIAQKNPNSRKQSLPTS